MHRYNPREDVIGTKENEGILAIAWKKQNEKARLSSVKQLAFQRFLILSNSRIYLAKNSYSFSVNFKHHTTIMVQLRNLLAIFIWQFAYSVRGDAQKYTAQWILKNLQPQRSIRWRWKKRYIESFCRLKTVGWGRLSLEVTCTNSKTEQYCRVAITRYIQNLS